MWWEPTNENDERVAAAVDRIAARMREGLGILPWLPVSAVTGVGSIFIAPRFRLLLLALDASSLPSLWSSHEYPWQEWYRWWAAHPWRHRRMIGDRWYFYKHSWTRYLIPLMDLAVPLAALRGKAFWNFDWSDIPDDAMVLLTEPPEPLLRGVTIWSGKSRGSIGLAVEFEKAGVGVARGYTTAGHVIEGAFVRQKLGLLDMFWKFRHLDRVVAAANSAEDVKAQGYDIAVVASPASLHGSASLSVNGASQPQDIDEDSYLGCTMLGGKSGVRYGFIYGAMKLQRGRKGELWENCWTVAGARGWIAKQGDSGAAVVLNGSAKILGHLVGGTGTQYRGRFELGWVQDIQSQRAFLNRSFSISLR